MKKITFVLAIILSAVPFVCSAQELSLTLDDAVSLALRDNRNVMLKAEEAKKAKAAILEARASLFPALNVSGGWSDTRGLYSKDVSAFAGQAQVKQTLYAGGKIINAIKAGEYAYTASEAALDKAKQDLVLSVKQAFYALMLGNELVSLNKGILDNTKEHIDAARARYKAGQASESDILRIESSLSGVTRAYTAAQSQAEAAAAMLRNLLYLDNEIKITPAAKFIYEPRELAYDTAFLKAMESRPEIRQIEAQRSAALKNMEAAKAGTRPTIYASWDYYARSTALSGTAKNPNDYNIIGITVSWPVFDGWLTRAKIEKAVIDLKEAEILREKAGKDIALDVKTAYLDLKDSIAKMKSAADEAAVYKDASEVVRKKFESGIASLLDLRDALLSYSVSLFNQSQAIYDYKIAQARFDHATGGI
ncbi:MAG TPA: TolC family protein [Candidatus Omnitrophota bacterium]|nr:TolC family protein [Candidatus Omnitrophota bacterium]